MDFELCKTRFGGFCIVLVDFWEFFCEGCVSLGDEARGRWDDGESWRMARDGANFSKCSFYGCSWVFLLPHRNIVFTQSYTEFFWSGLRWERCAETLRLLEGLRWEGFEIGCTLFSGLSLLCKRFLGKIGMTDKRKWRIDILFVFIIIVFLYKSYNYIYNYLYFCVLFKV